MSSHTSKEYDLVVLGATGYTGKYVAEYVTSHLPTTLKWAVAGRSETKLASLVDELRTLNPDRMAPGVEVASLSPDDLDNLVRKTYILINTVGPYHLYSSPVVEACAKNGTHYLDVTGEAPWVLDMIKKHHSTAQSTSAIIIPEIGIESAPSDLLTWSLATLIRRTCGTGITSTNATVYEMNSRPSGGTLATILTTFDSYSPRQVASANSGRWASSPVPPPPPPPPKSSSSYFSSLARMVRRIIGVRTLPHLGLVIPSAGAGPNVNIVQRSWGLLDRGAYYGPRFSYHEYASVRNRLVGWIVHTAIMIGALSLILPPVRWLAKKLVFAPGQGVSREDAARDRMEFWAVATADEERGAGREERPRQAFARFRFEGGMYYLTGLLLAEAAMVLLEDEKLVARLGGGLLTPAMLGQHFVDRIVKAGVVLETEMLPE